MAIGAFGRELAVGEADYDVVVRMAMPAGLGAGREAPLRHDQALGLLDQPRAGSRSRGIHLPFGGSVARKDARAEIGPNQSTRRACPVRQSKSAFRASRPSAQASVSCAMLSAPRM